MPTWIYVKQVMQEGARVNTDDGDMLVGSSLESDGKGGYRIVVHLLKVDRQMPVALPIELPQ